MFVHTSFALHYAHEYYGEGVDRRRGGLNFPAEGGEPDYCDFLYFAANIRAAGQTFNAVITGCAIRRAVLAHTILAFLCKTTILARCQRRSRNLLAVGGIPDHGRKQASSRQGSPTSGLAARG